jgi:glutathione S-transferase
MKLYYWPKTRAFRGLWMMEELGIEYELALVDITTGEQRTEEFRKINPMMKIPAIEDGKMIMADSSAILLYLADKYPEANLAPPAGSPLRGRYLQWLFFAGGSLEPAMAERFSGSKPNPMSFGWGDLARVTQALEDELAGGPWIIGKQFTAADILLGDSARIAIAANLWDDRPPVSDYLARIAERPAYIRAREIDDRQAEMLK